MEPTPPIASFTFSPASPVAGQAVSFNATSSTCPDGPCTYAWSDDGGTTRPIPALWPLGSGQTLDYTFSGSGTKYVRLVVTDATGQTATVEHNIVVAEPTPPPPPPPSVPTVSAMPAITGLATAGETLNATAGAWTGSPTAYAYQWRHCTSSASSCTSIAGAVASSYRLASSDVGQRMSVTVTATNAGGSSSANASMTAMVTAPLPPAPVNTAPPKVSGSAVEGQTLSVTTGAWTGEPTSYGYQWQDCNSSGEDCSNRSGATGSSYVLATGNVGHTVRVLVSATNEGGSTSVSSTATALVAAVPSPPPPTPPTASFTYSPLAPVTGQQITFAGTSSTCSDSPCTYQWSDDGGTTRPVPALWPLGSGQTLQFAFSGAGTKYVRLLVTDAAGQTATVEHNVVVAEPTPPPPPPPVAPSNTAAPVVSGTPEVGQTLSASNGTWSGSTPMSDTYQWQDCSASGTGCANVSGAAASTYTLAASDVGHTMSVVVSASNAGGSTAATSAHTAVITAADDDPEEPSLTATHCWNEVETEGAARLEACGYPGPNNTGVEKGVTLTESSEDGGPCHVVLTGTEHYEDKRVKGTECGITIAVSATGVVIKNDEVDEENACKEALCYVNPIQFDNSGEEGAKGTRIEHVFVHAPEKGPAPRVTHNVAQTCINGEFNDPYVAEYVRAEHCSGFKLNAGGTLNHVYCPSNYEIAGEHMECVTDDSEKLNAAKEKTPLIIENSTIFQQPPKNQEECENGAHEIKLKEESGCPGAGMTAAFFPQGEVAPIQEIRLEKDFFDGGAFTIYGGNEDDGITGPFIVRKDRFARCLAATCPKSLTEEAQGGGLQKIRGNTGDEYGYYERGGVYGVAVNLNKGVTTWAENFWDNNREAVAE